MAVKSSGSLSITTDIVGEFGGQAPHSLSEYYRNGGNVPDAGANSAVPTSGSITFSDFYGTLAEIGSTVTASTTSLNLYDKIVADHGAQSAAGTYRVTIDSGVTIGGVSGSPNNAALSFGNFPDGSTITLVNNGTIDGRAGSAGSGGSGATGHSTAPSGSSGGSGGDAIYANYSSQTMNIINNGSIRGGGGGGAGGGGGGKGGDGRVTNPGGPYPWTSYTYNRVSPSTYWRFQDSTNNTFDAYLHRWNGTNVSTSSSTSVSVGGYDYQRGPFQSSEVYVGTKNLAGGTYYYYSIRRKQSGTTPATYTYYDGGNGGSGGSGGIGQGYNQAKTNGSGGSGGSTGPGPAGNGGTGGSGGNGGTFGNSGSNGGTGNSGTAGNYPPGASSGGSGGSGGSAGRYLVKGSQTVTVTGSGTTAGGTA